jgi:hypothetical protein
MMVPRAVGGPRALMAPAPAPGDDGDAAAAAAAGAEKDTPRCF